jgi:hypothetical protein
MACLKHMSQETGTNPSPAKLELYFAELVTACRKAKDQWITAGRPQSLACAGITPGVGKWNIHIRLLFGKPQIFHVDSGYAASEWVKHLS